MEVNTGKCLESGNNLALQQDIRSELKKDCSIGRRPDFSIVIPTYRRVAFLRECLRSAFSQKTEAVFDVIVVEDNPEPGTEIEEYLMSLSEPRLKYYKNLGNLGLVGNFNRVLSLADGDVVVVIHDDDLLLPDYLETMGRIMKARPDADIVCPLPLKWNEAAGESCPLSSSEAGTNCSSRLWKPVAMMEPFCRTFIPTGMSIRRSSVEKSGGFDYGSGPSTDLYFIVRAALSGLVYYHYDKPLFIYRWSENESLKFETRKAFLEAGLPLRRHILERSRLPKILGRALLRNYSYRGMKDLMEHFPERQSEFPDMKAESSALQRRLDAFTADAVAACLRARKYFFPRFR